MLKLNKLFEMSVIIYCGFQKINEFRKMTRHIDQMITSKLLARHHKRAPLIRYDGGVFQFHFMFTRYNLFNFFFNIAIKMEIHYICHFLVNNKQRKKYID